MINKYDVIVKVVELNSISKTAEEINMTQSGVSHVIRSFENEFGITLFYRSRHGVKLTSDGMRLIPLLKEMVNMNERIMQEINSINNLDEGIIKVGSFPSVTVQWLPGIIKNIQTNYPNIEISLKEGNYQLIENWILKGEVDCGFVVGSLNFNSLELNHLIDDQMLCIVSKDNRLALNETVSFQEIESEHYIIPRDGGDIDVRELFKKYQLKPRIRYELLDTNQGIISMVQNNLGISILPKMMLKQLPDNVRAIPLEFDSYRRIGIASKRGKSAATKLFLKHVQSFLHPDPS